LCFDYATKLNKIQIKKEKQEKFSKKMKIFFIPLIFNYLRHRKYLKFSKIY